MKRLSSIFGPMVLVKYCQFGVSPVNHSDSDIEVSDRNGLLNFPGFILMTELATCIVTVAVKLVGTTPIFLYVVNIKYLT